MATSNPSTLFDYQAILDAAKTKLGQVTADADKAEEQARQLYNQQLAQSSVKRGKATVASRERSSARGLLDSGIALQGQADVNQAYDQINGGYLRSYQSTIDQIARQRLDAINNEANAETNFENYRLLGLDQNSPGIPNPDPYNWQQINSDLQAGVQPATPVGNAISKVKARTAPPKLVPQLRAAIPPTQKISTVHAGNLRYS